MAPIPVHIDAPITPVKPQGVTPQTAANEPVVPAPASNVATTTAPAQIGGYQPARPGAAAAAPTPYIQSPQPSATRTTSASQNQDLPPPPQPGAVPVPPQYGQAAATATIGLPPPPRAGESVQQATGFAGALNSMYTPPPAQQLQQNYAPTHSTTTATTPSRSGPTTLNLGPVASPTAGGYQDVNRRVSSEHPPGYVQNVYAQELNAQQRASLEQETRRESFVDKLGLGGVGGTDPGLGGERRTSDGVGGAWDAAKGWIGKAGTAIVEGEQEVWRRINGH